MKNDCLLKWPLGQLDFSGGCLVMGILNVTPDSFSDGGQFSTVEKAVSQGLKMEADGAAIIDVGAESTRPGSEAVTAQEQIKRAVPVIQQLAGKVSIPISIDTCDPEVAAVAIDAGASIINDISAMANVGMAKLAVERKVPVILMHMQGSPKTMQATPDYEDVVAEVLEFLVGRAKAARDFGIDKEMIFIDPGIGFGKTLEHNLLLLKNIGRFVETGYKVLVGASRKRFIGQITNRENPADRIFGTAGTVALSAVAGVSVVRVHDVAEMLDTAKIATAIKNGYL